MASYARKFMAKLTGTVIEDDDEALNEFRALQRRPSRSSSSASTSSASDSHSQYSEARTGDPEPLISTTRGQPPAHRRTATGRVDSLLGHADNGSNVGSSAPVRHSSGSSRSSGISQESPNTTPNGPVKRTSSSRGRPTDTADDNIIERHDGVVGVIQILNAKGGIIENKYWFDPRDFCINGKIFKLGDQVEFNAEQRRDDVKFHITTMKHYISPEESQMFEKLNYVTETGYIIKMAPDGGALVLCKNNMKINVVQDKLPKECKLGDWLQLKVKFGELNEASASVDCEVLSTRPTMTKKLQGGLLRRVDYREYGNLSADVKSYIQSGVIWCIDDKIIADEKLVRLAGAKHDTYVIVEAVESNQGTYNYRATHIECLKNPGRIRQLRQGLNKPTENAMSAEQQQFLNTLYNNKDGIIISPKRFLKFGNVTLHTSKEKTITIQNTKTTPLFLNEVKMSNDQSIAKFEPNLPTTESEDLKLITIIQPGDCLHMKIKATALLDGATKEMIVFDFNGYKIARTLEMTGCSQDLELDDKNGAYQDNQSREFSRRTRYEETGRRNGRNDNDMHKEYVEKRKQLRERESARGAPALRPAFFGQKNFRLDAYEVPPLIAEAHKTDISDKLFKHFPTLTWTEEYLETKPKMMPLTPENYSNCFQAGLWLEEMEDSVQLDQLSLKGVQLFREINDIMYFQAPNYEPSQIQLGMSFVVYDEADPSGKRFDSSITKIDSTGIIYGHFSKELIMEYKDQPMCVSYRLSRTTYRRWHFAATHAMETLGKEWLFPEKLQVQPPRLVLIENEHDEGSDEDEEAQSDLSEPRDAIAVTLSEPENSSTTSSAPDSPEKNEGRNLVRMRPDKFRNLQRNRKELDMRMASVFSASVARKHVADVLEKDVKLTWFNKELNSEQREAVRRILKGQCRPHPFVIHGPPGTGKTVTLVEAVLQVNKLFKNSRILITAPTNAAADLITEYLAKSGRFGIGEMTRLLGFSRSCDTASNKIKQYCCHPESVQNVARSSIVITTTNSVALLFEAGIAEDNFSHVFIDEAGCCFEPDGILPAMFVNVKGHGQLIMAGDHKQLGPHVHSNNAKFYGLEISFLQRIMETKLYSTASSDSVLVTKLIKNYRSHEIILKVPSQLFYNDELVAQTNADETLQLLAQLQFNYNPYTNDFRLPNPNVPLWFCGIRAQEQRDPNTYSWYNLAEVNRIVLMVEYLIKCGCMPSEIGIITPYRKQVEKLRFAIERKLRCDLPKVGTVEVFQGDERKIIILSLVRSDNLDKVTPYKMSKMAFVFSETRTNVMLTRARCLQIVVGNPHLFCASLIWKRYIEYCISLGAYDGCELPPDINPQLRELLEQVKLSESQPSAPQPQPDLLQNPVHNPYEESLFDDW